MKTYVFSTTEKDNKYGRTVTAKVYRIKNNTPNYLGERVWESQSCKGTLSEVFTFLYHTNEITKPMYKEHDEYYAGVGVNLFEV